MLAQQFLRENASTDLPVTQEQAYMVYKILGTPQDMLVASMNRMQQTFLTQFYRKLAIQLHPDKNAHPQATDAFQALQGAMEVVKANMTKNDTQFASPNSTYF